MAKADYLVESLPEELKLELERLENVVDFPMKYYTYNAQNQMKFNCHLVKDEILEERPIYRSDIGVLLYENGGNGKSALLNIFSHFLGTQNITHMTLHEIADDKFMKAQLYGKLANICGDIDSKAINNTGIIKNLTGVEPIQAQFKGIDSFSFQSFAKLMFSANKLPKTIDKTNGWFRRWFIIPFEKSIPEEKKIERSELDKRLTNPKELSGLLNLVLEAVKKLEKSGYKFTIPETAKKAIDEYQLASDDLAQFIQEHCVVNKSRNIKVRWTHFYSCFKDWFISENNEIPDSKKIIQERLAEKGFKVELGAGNNRWLMGLSFKENSEYFKR